MGSSHSFQVARTLNMSKCMIAVLGFILVVYVAYFSLGYIFTSVILILSTVFCTSFSCQNPKKSLQINVEEEQGCSEVNVESKYIEEVTESVEAQVADNEEENTCNDDNDDDHSISTSEDDKDRQNNYVARSSLSSEDGSISDEDSLIEIELPTGHYLKPKKHKQRPRWMELLSEANIELATEENLIEIDITIGSIICPRFEIEA